jgi:hypothetical protein
MMEIKIMNTFGNMSLTRQWLPGSGNEWLSIKPESTPPLGTGFQSWFRFGHLDYVIGYL